MGHEDHTLTDSGKNKNEALGNALDEFRAHHGDRYSVSKVISAKYMHDDHNSNLQVWQFEIDFHV